METKELHKEFCDLREAAAYMSVSVDTVRRLVADRAISHYPIRPGRGGKIILRISDIEAYLAALRVPSVFETVKKVKR